MHNHRASRIAAKQRTPFRVARDRLGMTQEALAKELGVSTNTVTRWEIGIHPIPRWAHLALKRIKAKVA